jgi:hypothetical protein
MASSRYDATSRPGLVGTIPVPFVRQVLGVEHQRGQAAARGEPLVELLCDINQFRARGTGGYWPWSYVPAHELGAGLCEKHASRSSVLFLVRQVLL